MKFDTLIKITLIVVFLFISCEEADITKPCEDPFCGCPPPVMGIDGVKLPFYNYIKPKISFSQNRLAFFVQDITMLTWLKIWDKKKNTIIDVNTNSLISPPSEIARIINFSWCPYDDNQIALLCWVYTDTSSTSEKKNVLGKRLYIYELDNKTIKDISPSSFGKYGFPNDPTKSYVNHIIWLPNSTPNDDFIYFPEFGLFNLQKNLIDSNYFAQNSFFEISKDSKYRAKRIIGLKTTAVNGVEINGMQYYFSDIIAHISRISISPNSEKIAFSVDPVDTAKSSVNERWKEIWILNTKDIIENNPYKNLKIINLRRDFCKYAFMGLNAEFITNNSLVVSMNSDGDDIAPLFEISLDGKIIRQITDK